MTPTGTALEPKIEVKANLKLLATGRPLILPSHLFIMCYVTYLDCQVCKVKDKYVFHPCESFAEEHVDLARNGPLPSRKRFHCPELALPLPEDENSSHHICDLCLRNGIIYYQRTVVIEQQTQFNERYHASMYPAVEQSSPTPDIVEVDEDYQEDREEGELDYSSDDDQAEIRLFLH